MNSPPLQQIGMYHPMAGREGRDAHFLDGVTCLAAGNLVSYVLDTLTIKVVNELG